MTSLLLSLLLTPQVAAKNPFMLGADPHAQVVGDTVWIYPTDATHRIGAAFWAYASKDLRTWKEYGPILKFDEIPWIKEDHAPWHGAWAPALAQKGRMFYLYYSVGPQHPTPSRLGVAVSESPAGPFKDSGQPLFTGGEGFEAIDPMVFRDPKSGRYFLYAGGSAGAKLRVWEMNDDMVSLKREIPVETPKAFTEGSFMHYRKGIYYMSYSHGGWRDKSYSAYYSTAPTPIGPWTYRGPILASDENRKGPGHHSIFQYPGRDEWYIAYHCWPDRQGDGPYEGSRALAIDRLEYDKNGLIKLVKMTNTVPAWGRR
jgi:beta-xylosidase